MHSGRTLANQGSKEIECVVQSISSTTHSYTIQPTISADGKLLSPLYLVLKEIGGDFGSRVEKTLFKPTNVFVSASKSGKLTSDKNYSNYTFLRQIKHCKSNQIKYFFFSTDHFK